MGLITIMKALSHKNRLRILNLLKQRELCVCELENIMDITQSNASRHLNKLKQARIIKSEHKAQWVYYSLSEKLLKQHTFLKKMIDEELEELEECQEDNDRLKKYNKSNLTCEDLRKQSVDLAEIKVR